MEVWLVLPPEIMAVCLVLLTSADDRSVVGVTHLRIWWRCGCCWCWHVALSAEWRSLSQTLHRAIQNTNLLMSNYNKMEVYLVHSFKVYSQQWDISKAIVINSCIQNIHNKTEQTILHAIGTARQQSCGKVMFSVVSVYQSVHKKGVPHVIGTR